jgi:hypothetical protein
MLEFICEQASSRKLRLFGVACCWRLWHLLDPRSRKAVDAVEKGIESSRDEPTVYQGVRTVAYQAEKDAYDASGHDEDDPAYRAACAASDLTDQNPWDTAEIIGSTTNGMCQTSLGQTNSDFLRDIFGNPFRPVTVSPSWQTANVVALAQAIYDERAFERMPILGDALEDAGCTSAEILAHCRGPGPHVRGCWVVDLLLGKE